MTEEDRLGGDSQSPLKQVSIVITDDDRTNVEKEVVDDHETTENDIGSELATGSDTALFQTDDEDIQDADRLSVVSDTGWDTDLEIEEDKQEYDPSGCQTYINACKVLGIIPATHFIRNLQAEESSIDLSHHYVGIRGAKSIAVALTSNTVVTHLNLSNNGLGTEGGIAIVDMLKENCYITHLDLSDNNLGPSGAYSIADMLSFNNTVTHCYLSGNEFDDKAAEPISEAIKGSLRVTYLDISHNMFSEPSGSILGAALAESEVLQTLDLSWNHLRRKGAIALAQGLKNNQMLKVLNLSYNGFGTDGAIALAEALKLNTTLTELDITDNRILVEGAKAFAKVLPNCESLSVLKIGRNPIQMAGVISLLESLKTGTSSVKHLGLNGITVTLEISKVVKAMEEDIPKLKIPHGGTGGYKEPKPLPTPIQKLTKYATENNVKLKDLFTVFDKEKLDLLTEEEFRASLKHISAPLMEFEVLKLIKEFGKKQEKSTEEEGTTEETDQLIVIDYNALIEAITTTNC